MLIRSRMGVSADGFVATADGPLPPETPPGVVAVSGGPVGAVERLRNRGSDGDVHVVGGPRTIEGLAAVGALDRLELVVLPVVLGEGARLTPPTTPRRPLALVRPPETYPDGSVELVYQPGDDNGGHS